MSQDVGNYRDPAEFSFRCPYLMQDTFLLQCLSCSRYPCVKIDDEKLGWLAASLFIDREPYFTRKRIHTMYIFKHANGTLTTAPETFKPDKPDFSLLEDVEEVYVVSDVLVKEVRLVKKGKSERDGIRRRKRKADTEG